MLATSQISLPTLLRWLRRAMTVALIVANFATTMLAGAAPARADTQPSFPIRAAFYYPWFPQAWDQYGIYPYTNYHPSLGFYDGGSQTVIQQHIAAMQYGGIQAGIASWWGQGSREDVKMPALLQAAAGTSFRWSVYYEAESTGNPTVAQLTSDLTYLRDHYGNDPSFLRVNGRFVVFVYSDGSDNCGMADRWKQANTLGAYVVLKVFNGYRNCINQPDSWHQYSPAIAADSQQGYSYSIAPGFWQKGASIRLGRDLNRWNQNVKDMVASGAAWQLIATFNEWGEGTAVESAQEWATNTGYGAFLDILHNNGGQSTPTLIPPTQTPTAASVPPTQTSQPTATQAAIVTSAAATGSNLVLNAGFETAGTGAADAANWTEGSNHTRASDKFHTGGWALHSTFRGAGTDTRTSAPIPVSPNTTYTYSGWVWRTNSTGGACMDMNDIAGERQLCTSAAGSWQSLSATWSSGSNTSVTLRLITDASPTGDIWFDDISLAGPSGPTPTSVPPTATRVAPSPTNTAVPSGDPVIAAAGDMACDPANSSFNSGNGTADACRQKYTSDLLLNAGLSAVLTLGDTQYFCGSYQAFMQSYDLSWGRVKSITRPVVGNHEYLTSGDPSGAPSTGCTTANAGAAGYFQYFGAAAGDPSQGYYSYDLGAWHLIAINSNCGDVGGCSPSSPQGQWLAADLAAHPNMCTLAYYHIPLYSSGGRAAPNTQDLWQMLYNAGVEVVLTGHDHIYERFAPQGLNAALDTARGIQEFIIGSGGANHTSIAAVAANSQVRNADTYGVLKLTLHPSSYSWQFVPEAGKTFTDSGSRNCFTASPIQPTKTAQPTATAAPSQTLPPVTNTPSVANLVLNPGFETAGTSAADAANWTEGSNHTRASDKFHTGGWALHSTFRGAGTATHTTAPIAVRPNTTYTYSGYIWRTNSTGGTCLDMNDIVGEKQLCTSTSGSWQFLSGTWNSGSNTSVTLRLITDGSPTGDIWFDDISLK